MFIPAPHVIPYQGSKRKLAKEIIGYMPNSLNCLYEPFAGSAAITLAAAINNVACSFVLSDKLEPLANLWMMIVNEPHLLIDEYSVMWNEQLSDPVNYYLKVRSEYNIKRDPSKLLYLIARCVKNAIRFNGSGEFNQGADKRRLGLKPEKLAKEVLRTSKLLKNKIQIHSGDFRDILHSAGKDDLVYMDPPWQGTSGKRDPRYAFLLEIDELITELASLNSREVPFILSFDGTCGDRAYGEDLPKEFGMRKISINAGRSSQATLLGRNEETIESLYLSSSLILKLDRNIILKKSIPIQAEIFEFI
jgi:DNA adenine methylase